MFNFVVTGYHGGIIIHRQVLSSSFDFAMSVASYGANFKPICVRMV